MAGGRRLCVELEGGVEKMLAALSTLYGSEERAVKEAIVYLYFSLAETPEKMREILFRQMLEELHATMQRYEQQLKDYLPYRQLKSMVEHTLEHT